MCCFILNTLRCSAAVKSGVRLMRVTAANRGLVIHWNIKMQSAAMSVHPGVRNQHGCHPVAATSAGNVAGGFFNPSYIC